MTPVTISAGNRQGVALALVDGLTYTFAGLLPRWATHVTDQLFVGGRRAARIVIRGSNVDGCNTVVEVVADSNEVAT
jgi:hypothetical protein